MKRIDWSFFIFIFMLFAIGNAADYFYQADVHGWVNPLWERGARAAHWAWYLDWIPHDGWHIAQWLRNTLLILPAALHGYNEGIFDGRKWGWIGWVTLIGETFLLYVISRGATFSLLLKVWN